MSQFKFQYFDAHYQQLMDLEGYELSDTWLVMDYEDAHPAELSNHETDIMDYQEEPTVEYVLDVLTGEFGILSHDGQDVEMVDGGFEDGESDISLSDLSDPSEISDTSSISDVETFEDSLDDDAYDAPVLSPAYGEKEPSLAPSSAQGAPPAPAAGESASQHAADSDVDMDHPVSAYPDDADDADSELSDAESESSGLDGLPPPTANLLNAMAVAHPAAPRPSSLTPRQRLDAIYAAGARTGCVYTPQEMEYIWRLQAML